MEDDTISCTKQQTRPIPVPTSPSHPPSRGAKLRCKHGISSKPEPQMCYAVLLYISSSVLG